ncbi:chemotaxis protein histidine kinase CheA [Rhizobium leguminosarum]|nr:chemotaxis protein histidine kinase CheA [Rhizobium leguminosarum]
MSTLDPVAVFRTEAAECLEAIEAGLLDLTHQLDNKDLVDAVFRGLHTLKGSGAMFGFEALAAFTHHCETAFDRVRKGEVAATSELVAAVLAAQDHMRALVDQPDADHGDTGSKEEKQLAHPLQPARQFDGQRHQSARPAGRAARSRRMHRARQHRVHSVARRSHSDGTPHFLGRDADQ